MATAAVLYTPDVLALATGLSDFPWDDDLPLKGSARSRSCGSTLALGLRLGDDGRIAAIGIRAQACAIGQAAAAIFAEGARGLSREEIHAARAAIAGWLAGEGPLPGWPGLAVIAAAQGYPGRHGAVMLAWLAASDLLP